MRFFPSAARDEKKQSVPCLSMVGEPSFESELRSFTHFGGSQSLPLRSDTQMSMSGLPSINFGCCSLGRGRVEMKYKRLPSGEIAGSRSEEVSTDQGNAVAGCHAPSSKCEWKMWFTFFSTSRRVKRTSWPSGVNVTVNSCPVEITFGANTCACSWAIAEGASNGPINIPISKKRIAAPFHSKLTIRRASRRFV